MISIRSNFITPTAIPGNLSTGRATGGIMPYWSGIYAPIALLQAIKDLALRCELRAMSSVDSTGVGTEDNQPIFGVIGAAPKDALNDVAGALIAGQNCFTAGLVVVAEADGMPHMVSVIERHKKGVGAGALRNGPVGATLIVALRFYR
ncbi:MAG: hypothetical protein LBJ12_09845 [Oscillospiraceae bacterium]|jgi:hypothetical protein|nr:hypothetical protein [Oscillospiraceae bacterium]